MTQHNGKSRFAGKVAIITGAGSGIGKATALKLASEGAHVALFDLVNDRISKTEDEINSVYKGAARAFDVDISDASRVEKAVLETVELFGGLDIVFANAGINGVSAPIEEIQVEDWQQIITTNLDGTFFTIKYALPHLKNAVEAALLLRVPSMEISVSQALACRLIVRPRRDKWLLPRWLRWSSLNSKFE